MKLVVIDRDGVINKDSPAYIKSSDEWHPIAGSLEAIALLNQAGFTVAVATNQSGIARGLYTEESLQAIHEKMHLATQNKGGKIDSLFYCPHGPEDNCPCRKPKPGLLEQIAEHYGVSLEDVPYVGDSYRDLEAAMNAGAKPVLVLTGNGHQTLAKHSDKLHSIPHYKDLLAFARHYYE